MEEWVSGRHHASILPSLHLSSLRAESAFRIEMRDLLPVGVADRQLIQELLSRISWRAFSRPILLRSVSLIGRLSNQSVCSSDVS